MSGVGVERLLKLPPRIKVLEASGAIADGRVKIVKKRNGTVIAKVSSSMGDREYTVIVKRANGEIFRVYSDDNGTKYRNYIGYPIIAVLMLEGILPRRHDIEEALSGINWRELNEKYKRYVIVEGIVLSDAEAKGVPRDDIRAFVGDIMSKLSGLKLIYDPSLVEKLRVWL